MAYNGNHLGWRAVREIRADFESPAWTKPPWGLKPGDRKKVLAKRHGVSVRTIQRIIAGSTWKTPGASAARQAGEPGEDG